MINGLRQHQKDNLVQVPAQSGHSQLKSVTSSYCPCLEGHTAVLHAVNPSPARAEGSWMLLQGPGSPSAGTLWTCTASLQGCALPLGQAALTAHPGGARNPRRGLGDGQVSWHPHSLSVSILPAPDSKPGSASVFTSVPNFPICSFIACSCCRERCIQDFLRSGFPFLTLRSNTS